MEVDRKKVAETLSNNEMSREKIHRRLLKPDWLTVDYILEIRNGGKVEPPIEYQAIWKDYYRLTIEKYRPITNFVINIVTPVDNEGVYVSPGEGMSLMYVKEPKLIEEIKTLLEDYPDLSNIVNRRDIFATRTVSAVGTLAAPPELRDALLYRAFGTCSDSYANQLVFVYITTRVLAKRYVEITSFD